MNHILTIAVIGVLAASILLVGASTPIFAQENMTMNTSSTPVDNTTELSDTGMGMDANTIMGNSTSDNSTAAQ